MRRSPREEERLAILSVNSFQWDKTNTEEDKDSLKSLSFGFDKSSLFGESSLSFVESNDSCQPQCSFLFWRQKFKFQRPTLNITQNSFRKIVRKTIYLMGVIPSSSSHALSYEIESAAISGLLVLTNRGIQRVPLKISTLGDNLRLLDLSANKLSSLPPSISRLSKLKSLFLNQNRFTSLPDEMFDLPKLEFLSVSYNLIEVVPQNIQRLTNLRELKLGGNRIKTFPNEVVKMAHLRLLDLSFNIIETIPANSFGFENFQVIDLNLNENNIFEISPDLALAPQLKILRLQNNHLSLNAIPEQLLADSKVSMLLLEGNLFEVEALRDLDGYESYIERQEMNDSKLSLRPPSSIGPV